MTTLFSDPNLIVLFAFLLSFAIVYASVPTIVNVAHMKKLYDEPGMRRSHTSKIPNLGGIAIFAGLVISFGIFTDLSLSRELGYLFISLVILFFVGLKDDILIIAPAKKLYGEILAAIVIAIIADTRFTSLHGFFGIYNIPYLPSVLLTVFVMVVIINSFNLIDGIDGLASGIGVLVSATFGIWFFLIGQTNYTVLSAALLGALACFFGYNVFGKKNKIFMGDTGSLILGLVISIIVIKFNEINSVYTGPYKIIATPAVSFGILFIPLFDTIRVFTIRMARGRSPFHADKNHIHHRVLQMGFSHLGSTFLLLTLNLGFIGLALFCQFLGVITLILLSLSIGFIFTLSTELIIRKNKQKEIKQAHSRHHARA